MRHGSYNLRVIFLLISGESQSIKLENFVLHDPQAVDHTAGKNLDARYKKF